MLQLAHELGMYTSIISNGSHLTKAFLEEHTHALNMLGLSCDTADDELAAALGRGKQLKMSFTYLLLSWLWSFWGLLYVSVGNLPG